MPYIQLKGRFQYFETVGEGRNKRLIGKFTDGTGVIDLVWFKGVNYILEKYKPGGRFYCSGKPVAFGRVYNIPHPDIDPMSRYRNGGFRVNSLLFNNRKDEKAFLNSRAIPKSGIYHIEFTDG